MRAADYALIPATWPRDIRTRRLRAAVGLEGAWALVELVCWQAATQPDIDLSTLTPAELEDAAGWCGTPGAWRAAMVAVGFLTESGGWAEDPMVRYVEQRAAWVAKKKRQRGAVSPGQAPVSPGQAEKSPFCPPVKEKDQEEGLREEVHTTARVREPAETPAHLRTTRFQTANAETEATIDRVLLRWREVTGRTGVPVLATEAESSVSRTPVRERILAGVTEAQLMAACDGLALDSWRLGTTSAVLPVSVFTAATMQALAASAKRPAKATTGKPVHGQWASVRRDVQVEQETEIPDWLMEGASNG
jgi:hypothetical protein